MEPEELRAMQMPNHQVQHTALHIWRVNLTVDEPDSDDSALARLTTTGICSLVYSHLFLDHAG